MKALLLLIILGTLNVSDARATPDSLRSCPLSMPSAPCSEFWKYDTVFIGTVKQLVNEPFPKPMEYHWQTYQKVTATIVVEEMFRGKLPPEIVVEMGDCYFEFTQGAKYLLYANKGQDGQLAFRRHFSRTRLLSDAREDLDYIRSLPDAPSGGRISGSVYDHRSSVPLDLNNEGHSSNNTKAGVTIHLRNAANVYQTISDATGYYEFTRVPAGEYEISTDLPEYLSGSRHPVKVIDKGCEHVTMSIQATGEIQGRLINAKGEPVEKAMISIFSADGVSEDIFERLKVNHTPRALTGPNGFFSFGRLPSGRYHLAVNMVDVERENSSTAKYPRIFYPGVESFKAASPIVLANGAKLYKIEFKLPPHPPTSTP